MIELKEKYDEVPLCPHCSKDLETVLGSPNSLDSRPAIHLLLSRLPKGPRRHAS